MDEAFNIMYSFTLKEVNGYTPRTVMQVEKRVVAPVIYG